jgi:acid phosphatase type 7
MRLTVLVLSAMAAIFGVMLVGLWDVGNAQAQEVMADPVLAAAGDIATCPAQNDEATAALLGQMPGATVAALGDNAYLHGSAEDYLKCYTPSWGAYKALTRPTAGNHEYETPNASGYFTYFREELLPFGAAACDPTKGYYSYDLGSWHVVVLNSNCRPVGGCGGTSPQVEWLKADLAAHPSTCTLAYWHHPRFSSRQTSTPLAAFWNALYKARAEVVLNGHMHNYERFVEQTPGGVAKAGRGIREFVVGTGGTQLVGFPPTTRTTSEVRDANTFGVLKLTLHANSYDWQFVPVAGQSFTDSGTTNCH